MHSPFPYSSSKHSGKRVNFRSSSTQNVTDQPPPSTDDNDEEYLGHDFVENQSSAEEGYEDDIN